MSPRIRRKRDGTYSLNMPSDQRELLKALLPQIRTLVEERDSMAWRLFPNAYQDDPEKAAEYEDMVGDELRTKRLAAIDLVEHTLDEVVLTEDQLMSWMGAVNDLRLVLGTRLDVNEETDIDHFIRDVERSLFSAFAYLGHLMEVIVSAISSGQQTLD